MKRTEELWSNLVLERVDEGGRVGGELAERSGVGRVSESVGRHCCWERGAVEVVQ